MNDDIINITCIFVLYECIVLLYIICLMYTIPWFLSERSFSPVDLPVDLNQKIHHQKIPSGFSLGDSQKGCSDRVVFRISMEP